jgi:hypothetical protein
MLRAKEHDLAVRYLTAIEKKHSYYFTQNNLKITDCVTISNSPICSVHIINQTLPFEIKDDIESMFWCY